MLLAPKLLLAVILVFLLQLDPTMGSANVSVVEKGTQGAVVYTVSQVCPEFPPNSMNSLIYGYLDPSFHIYFNLSSDKTVLRLNSSMLLDRDQLAYYLTGNTILPVLFTFSILSPLLTCSISLRVLDLDDHTPTFPRSSLILSIPGGSSSPSSWTMDLAADPDEGANSTQNYYINATDPSVSTTFNLSLTRDATGRITLLQLVRKTIINPQVNPFFNFTIVAEEGRPNTPKGYQSVFITVQDVCDTPPAFQLAFYEVRVPENTSVNSIVLMVKANDVNLVRGGVALFYAITSQCAIGVGSGACTSGTIYPASGSTPFALDRVSGNLSLTQMLDYNTVRELYLNVTVTDSCNLVGRAVVHVTVVKVSVDPPIVRFIEPLGTIMLKEDYGVDSEFAVLSITSSVTVNSVVNDNSTGRESDTFRLILKVAGPIYRLTLIRPLNYKVRSIYNTTIVTLDVANNVVYTTFTIVVLQVNHPPVFDNRTAFTTIPISIRNGTAVLRVRASDSDIGSYGVVTYEIPPPSVTYPYQDNFTVSISGGDVIVNGNLDNSIVNTFLLLIKARDNPTDGVPYLSDYMVVNVTLVASYPTALPSQHSFVNISENVLVGTAVFKTYTNSTPNSYSLVPASSMFQIHSASGVVTVTGLLNYTATKQYSLSVVAYGSFSFLFTFPLTINILPGDAVGPVFSPRVYSVQVVRRAAVGTRFVDVKAVDTYSSALLYQIVDGNGEGKFTINPTNGTITILNPLEQAGTQIYTLMVKASDGRYYSKWLAQVVISVQDVVFDHTPYYFQVQEGQPSGTVVGNVSVLTSYEGLVLFSLASGSGGGGDSFSVDPQSGVITTTRVLVSTSSGVPSVALAVRVTASYTPTSRAFVQAAFQDISIFVTRSQPLYSETVHRSPDLGSTLLTLPSMPSGGISTYTLISSYSVPFQVNSSTGSVYTTEYLDSRPRFLYPFGIVITTTYSGPNPGQPLQTLATVTILVDLSIVFNSTGYNFTISSPLPKDSYVGVVSAVGRRNTPVYYNFSRDDTRRYLQVHSATGHISLLVDSSLIPFPLNADVLARDSLDPTLQSIAPVWIVTSAVDGDTSPAFKYTNVVVIGAVVGVALLLLLAVGVVALLTLRRRRSYDPKVGDQNSTPAGGRSATCCGNNNVGHEMRTFVGGEEGEVVLTAVKPVQGYPLAPSSTSSSFPSSSSGSKDEAIKTGHPESVSMLPNGGPVYSTDPLGRVPNHVRSTSDLASTVGTEVLGVRGMEGVNAMGPYTKAQLLAIYAANAQLLQEDGSQDSVHMFGSEGGVEAADEQEVDRMLFAKAIGFEEEQCGRAGQEGEEERGRYEDAPDDGEEEDGDGGKDLSAVKLGGDSSCPREGRGQGRYRFSEDSWLPAATSVTDAIDELVGEDPHYPGNNGREVYPLSQAVSLYSEGGSQSLLLRSQPHPHQYYSAGGGGGGSQHTSRSFHESSYFSEADSHGRHHQHHQHRDHPGPSKRRAPVTPSEHRYRQHQGTAAGSSLQGHTVHRYSSATAIPHHRDLQPRLLSSSLHPPSLPLSTGTQRKNSQDLPPPQHPNLRASHTPSSNTPTDDGLMDCIPPPRAPAYYSSISSLASTNLSQPGPRDHPSLY